MGCNTMCCLILCPFICQRVYILCTSAHTTKADTFLSFVFLGFLVFLPCGLHTFDSRHIRLLGVSVKQRPQ